MAGFESYNQYWKFAYFVRRKARHVMDAECQRFLDTVVETSAKRVGHIEQSAILWRAQLGNDLEIKPFFNEEEKEMDSFEIEQPHPPERMVPLGDRASEGRVNPKGIPCLYFSNEMETAMTETRPWIGSSVSVGQFIMLRPLKVVDCSDESPRRGIFARLTDDDIEKRESDVWADINRAFSEPVTRNDDVAEYAPTQVLAEVFRKAGFDGVVYGSKLGIGKTIAIFDLTAAELVNCHLYRVEGVSLKFSEAANPYFVGKYYEGKVEEQVVIPAGESGSLSEES